MVAWGYHDLPCAQSCSPDGTDLRMVHRLLAVPAQSSASSSEQLSESGGCMPVHLRIGQDHASQQTAAAQPALRGRDRHQERLPGRTHRGAATHLGRLRAAATTGVHWQLEERPSLP